MINPAVISVILDAIVIILGVLAIIGLFWWAYKDTKETEKLIEKERKIWRSLAGEFSIENGWRRRDERVFDAKDLELDKEP